jgi:PAS domain S-box-containing protein
MTPFRSPLEAPEAPVSTEAPQRPAPGRWWRQSVLAWAPILICAGIIITLRMMPIVLVPHWYNAFLPAFNFLFTTAISLLIVILMARSYFGGTSSASLWLGSGMMILGLASVVAGFKVWGGDLKQGVTLFNIGMFLGGFCQLVGAAQAHFPNVPRSATQQKVLVVLSLGLSAFALAAISLLTSRGAIPDFWTDAGSTPFRDVVLGAAAVQFALAAILIGGLYRAAREKFLYWYALGLVLLGLGLFGLLLIQDLNSLLAWASRGTQYVGGLYLLWAVLSLNRHGRWQLPLQRELQEVQTRYRLVFESMGEGFVMGRMIYDTEGRAADFQLMEVNAAFERLTGIPRRDALAKTVRGLIPTLEPESLANHAQVVETGRPLHWESFNQFTGKTYAIYSYRIAPGQFASVFSDLTLSRQAEQERRATELRFRAAVEHFPGVYIIYDRERRIRFINETGLQSARRPPSDILGKRDEEIWPEDVFSNYLPHLLNAWKTRQTQRFEMSICLPGNVPQTQIVTYIPLLDDQGEVREVLGVTFDITDRKQAEEALLHSENELRRLNQQLEQRVQERTAELVQRAAQLRALAGELTLYEQRERRRMARMLHDHLQQLLVGAKFRITALNSHNDTAVQQVSAKVGQLLDESIHASRSLTAELSPPILQVAGLNAGLEWLVRWMNDRHGLAVELTMDADPPLAEDVKVLLFESVRELLFNSVKHSQARSAAVYVRESEGFVQVTVVDQGCGFDVHAVRWGGDRAAGFGLFTIRERLELIGGRMQIDSTPGKGSRFELSAPIEATPAESHKPPVSPQMLEASQSGSIEAPVTGARIRVLLADDHVVMREGLAGLLEQAPDIQIIGQAGNGREAVDLAARLLPDVILMDISMPELNGIEATRIIHNKHPEISIIGLSMFDAADRAQAIRDAGAIGYLTKSGPPADLIAAIRQCMSGSGMV